MRKPSDKGKVERKSAIRLFGQEVEVETVPKKRITKKRKSVRIFGQDIVSERRKSTIKKTRNSSPPSPPAEIPSPMVETIRNMAGKGEVFVLRKILERSDTDAGLNRLFVPKSEVLWGLLSEAEKTAVEGGDGLGVAVVDPRGQKYQMKLKKWKSLNMIVLNSSGWREFVKDNELEAEVDRVELWSFRAESKLCFGMNVKRAGSPSAN